MRKALPTEPKLFVQYDVYFSELSMKKQSGRLMNLFKKLFQDCEYKASD